MKIHLVSLKINKDNPKSKSSEVNLIRKYAIIEGILSNQFQLKQIYLDLLSLLEKIIKIIPNQKSRDEFICIQRDKKDKNIGCRVSDLSSSLHHPLTLLCLIITAISEGKKAPLCRERDYRLVFLSFYNIIFSLFTA